MVHITPGSYHVHLVLIKPRHEKDDVLGDVTRIDGAVPHHLGDHRIGIDEREHLVVQAVPDIVHVEAYDSAQLGLDALGRPKLVLSYA